MEQQFFHVRMIVGVVVGLSVTNLLKGIAKFIVHPQRDKPYWLHLLWAAYFLILLVHFWWWEFGLRQLTAWEFSDYFYVVIFSTFFFLCSALLFPEHLDDYDGFREYYDRRMHWFFATLTLIYLLDIADTAIKGSDHVRYLGTEYFVSTALHAFACLVIIKNKNKRLHMAIVILFILYQFTWIYRAYRWLE